MWLRGNGHRWRRRDDNQVLEVPSPTIADECEAFLAGRLLEVLDARGNAVPVWTWLNPLAHAEPDRVRALALNAEPLRAGSGTPDDWRAAMACLADEMVRIAGNDPGVIQVLQRTALLPLELALPSGDDANARTPEQLLRLGQRALAAAIPPGPAA